MGSDLLDAALTGFAATAPEFGAIGLSNHGPMAAEVLERLGRADAIAGWAAAYGARLDPGPPPASRPLTEQEWPHALGDGDRYPAWLAHFELEMADRPLADVVAEWVPRLMPGAVGAATHGLIRTADAVRALTVSESSPRRLELAQALAYWAARYQELPGPPLLIGHQGVEAALFALPYLAEDTPRELLISAQVAHVADVSDEFEQSVASLGFAGTALELVDALAAGGARAYLRNAPAGDAIALLHAITAPLAVELLLPWVLAEDEEAVLGYLWQATAALHVTYDIDRREAALADDDLPTADELIDRAVSSGDEHALKLTEAVLRSHARTNDPALLLAAMDASARF